MGRECYRGYVPCTIMLLIVAAHTAAAAPNAAVRAACVEDAKRLCADVFGQARQACMRERRAELSENCKAAIAEFRGAGGKNAQQQHPAGGRRDRCIAYIQQSYRYKPKVEARPALVRCMHGEPIPADFNEKQGF